MDVISCTPTPMRIRMRTHTCSSFKQADHDRGGGMTARSSNGETPFSVKFPADPGEDTENHYLSRLPPAAGYLPDPH